MVWYSWLVFKAPQSCFVVDYDLREGILFSSFFCVCEAKIRHCFKTAFSQGKGNWLNKRINFCTRPWRRGENNSCLIQTKSLHYDNFGSQELKKDSQVACLTTFRQLPRRVRWKIGPNKTLAWLEKSFHVVCVYIYLRESFIHCLGVLTSCLCPLLCTYLAIPSTDSFSVPIPTPLGKFNNLDCVVWIPLSALKNSAC